MAELPVLLTAETVKNIPRPPGVSDEFILANQAEHGQPTVGIYAYKKEEFSIQARVRAVAEEHGDNFLTHLVHEPALEEAYLRVCGGNPPPNFEYEIIEVPCFPDTPVDQEVIPTDVLARYAKFGLSGGDLDYLRITCRKFYMKGRIYKDIVCHKHEHTAPVAIYETEDTNGKPLVIAACGYVQKVQENDDFFAVTLVPKVIERLLYDLTGYHALSLLTERARREKFGAIQYNASVRFHHTHGLILYMALAPTLSKREDAYWSNREPSKNGDPTELWKERLGTTACRKQFDFDGHAKLLPPMLTRLGQGAAAHTGIAPDLKGTMEHALLHKAEKAALEAALATERKNEEEARGDDDDDNKKKEEED